MAMDEVILESCGRGETLPTLRLYAWDPPCLSLGYAQSLREVDMPRLRERGWDLVRRPTGGKAILHTDELTYAVIGPLHHPLLAGSVLDSYRRLAQALLTALRHLGLPAEMHHAHPQQGATQDNSVCFEAPSVYEITVGGKKLLGSAQARRRQGVLQHGTLPLYGDLTRITQVLAFPDEEARFRASQRLLERATTVERILGRPLSWETAVQAFIEAFRQVFSIDFQFAAPTQSELARADELARLKYAYPDWPKDWPKPKPG